MFGKIKSSGLIGINGYVISVEIDISNGMPGFEVVGLPDAAVKEARERVRSAIRNSGFYFPSTRIIANLAPADTRKEGAVYDLAIACAILNATGQLKFDDELIFQRYPLEEADKAFALYKNPSQVKGKVMLLVE